jgi:hypothetical protein
VAVTLRAPLLALAVALGLAASARPDDPPGVEHQPAPCTVPDRPLSLCATVSDDGSVAAARVYFRREGERYFTYVNMVFTGVSYCGTVPGPRAKTKAVEYYVQAMDDKYQPTRTSTFRLAVEPEGVCEFPPIEKDQARAGAIRAFATHARQGRRLHDAFVEAGVTFVPVTK